MYTALYVNYGTSHVTQVVKNSPAMQETLEMRVGSLGWKDPLEKEIATYPSILAREIPCTEEPGGLWSIFVSRGQNDSVAVSVNSVTQLCPTL